MHDDIKERLRQMEKNFDGKAFWSIINGIKKDKINDDELLGLIADTDQKRFGEKVSFTLGVPIGNLVELAVTMAAIILALQVNSDWMLYISALVLMTTLHPLSHYITGSLLGIRFTHYYLDGPALVEPTLKIDYFSYLKAPAKARALMHASGVIGTVAAPLVAAGIALGKGASTAATYLFILFIGLMVFELLTSTRIGDLMRAKREYGYR